MGGAGQEVELPEEARGAKTWAAARADRRMAERMAVETRLDRSLPAMVSLAAAAAAVLAVADLVQGPWWRGLLIAAVAAPMLATWPRARARRRRFVTRTGEPAKPDPGPLPVNLRVWVLRQRPDDAGDGLAEWAASLRRAHPGLELREALALVREVRDSGPASS